MKFLKRFALWMSFLALVMVIGCQDEKPAEPQTTAGSGRLQGQVTMPLEGVRLYIYQPGMDLYGPAFAVSRATDIDGRFDIELPDGDYVVVARKRSGGEESGPVVAGDNRSEFMQVTVAGGVVTMQISAPLKIGDQRSFSGDAVLSKTGLAGRVLDSDGQPVEGARVHVYDHVQMSERPKFVSEKTGPDGVYLIALPAGGT
jgi:hypothetical protein